MDYIHGCILDKNLKCGKLLFKSPGGQNSRTYEFERRKLTVLRVFFLKNKNEITPTHKKCSHAQFLLVKLHSERGPILYLFEILLAVYRVIFQSGIQFHSQKRVILYSFTFFNFATDLQSNRRWWTANSNSFLLSNGSEPSLYIH